MVAKGIGTRAVLIASPAGDVDGPASGTSTAALCVGCTGQTITMRWTTTVHTIGPPRSEMEFILLHKYFSGN